jgi:hypothetical protein
LLGLFFGLGLVSSRIGDQLDQTRRLPRTGKVVHAHGLSLGCQFLGPVQIARVERCLRRVHDVVWPFVAGPLLILLGVHRRPR